MAIGDIKSKFLQKFGDATVPHRTVRGTPQTASSYFNEFQRTLNQVSGQPTGSFRIFSSTGEATSKFNRAFEDFSRESDPGKKTVKKLGFLRVLDVILQQANRGRSQKAARQALSEIERSFFPPQQQQQSSTPAPTDSNVDKILEEIQGLGQTQDTSAADADAARLNKLAETRNLGLRGISRLFASRSLRTATPTSSLSLFRPKLKGDNQ